MTEDEEYLALARQWSFPWPIMDVLIGGKSPIDLEKLSLTSDADARHFLKSYGYDPDRPDDAQRLHEIFIEATNFIECQLMPREWAQGNKPPEALISHHSASDLLLWASGKNSEPQDSKILHRLQIWSCAVLRVMHTIAHIDDLQRLNKIDGAKAQIMGRFQKALFRDKDGKLLFGNKVQHIELEKFEWKTSKTRTSMILKLLHKPANVAETIYDLLGVRIITKKLSDSMIAVKFLRQFYLVDFANIHPSRSRNNLIDTLQFHAHVETLRQMLISKKISPDGFREMLLYMNTPVTPRKSSNPHSSKQYRSIQLTCRQRVRYPDPNLTWNDKLRNYLSTNQCSPWKEGILREILELTEGWNHCGENGREISVFFPFEVQILDKEAAMSGEKGEASHQVYKKAQIRSARRRILGKVLGITGSSSQGSKI